MIVIGGFYGVVNLDEAHGGAAVVARACELAEQLVAGGAQVVQLRMKRAPGGPMLEVARALRTVLRDTPFIVNDRLDVALASGADGVHLGQDDLPARAARALAAGGRFVIGVSTHTPEQAEAAAHGGADYLGFGPVYATATKENPDPVQGAVALAAAVRRAAPVPVIAIGGITLGAVAEVAATGAAGACVISAVNGASDVAAAGRQVAAAFAAQRPA